jgi:biotin transport system substrate-specific component
MTSPSFVLTRTRDRRTTIVGIIGFAVAVAAASHVAIAIPGTLVPMTLQPLAVVLAGLWLGPEAGAASMVLYVLAGAAGLPVFAPMGPPGLARLFSHTGGYILAYPVAAFVAGWVALRTPSYLGRVMAAVLGIAAIYVGGLAQLTIITGSLGRAVIVGTLPFLALDIVKAFLAGLLSPRRSERAPD